MYLVYAFYFDRLRLYIACFISEQDFPSLKWFLPYCYGQEAPPDTTVGRMVTMTAENVNELLEEVTIPYLTVKHPMVSHTSISMYYLHVVSILKNFE